MFDVRPVNRAGDVDFGQIQSIKKVVSLKVRQERKSEGIVRKVSWEKRVNVSTFPQKKNIEKQNSESAIGTKYIKIRPKARAIQFNRYISKKGERIPHLIKTNCVSVTAKNSFSGVVARRETPQKISNPAIIRLPGKVSFERKENPTQKAWQVAKKERQKYLNSKKQESEDFDRKFACFFSDDFKEKEIKSEDDVLEVDLSEFFANQKKISEKAVSFEEKEKKEIRESFSSFNENQLHTQPTFFKEKKEKKKKRGFLKFLGSNYKNSFKDRSVLRPATSFAFLGFASLAVFGAVSFVSSGLQIKEDVQVRGEQVVGHLAQAQEELKSQNFSEASKSFEEARVELEKTKSKLNILGGDALDIFQNLPFLSKISSGKNVVDAGNELIKAAQEVSQAVSLFSDIDNPLEKQNSSKPMTEIFLEAQDRIKRADESLEAANGYMEKVKIEDLPAEYKSKFELIKNSLPIIISLVERLDQNSQVFLELMGHNGPRKYLFLFQNNQEMRATGGFIGSYGLLSISNGEVKNLLIDGIFNPDGQLKENIVPPKPIQKVSAGWSTHDANWYPNFPTSAKKIAWFYEKTGGPTVDGIITLTPTVLQKMLKVTGPIRMDEYDVTIDEENFVAKTQYEVEVGYDRELNQPKKFIADLAPQILDKLFSQKDPRQIAQVVSVLAEALKERHILLYSFDENVQTAISAQGWSGEILGTEKDYLMVVNSNINGFKTDGIIEEKIEHEAEIQYDGTVIDTVRITRKHNGGDSQYQWWNKVNSNYMRVYVPKGSQLISAKGHTREVIEPPIDYEKLHFQVHSDVLEQEKSMKVDQETGTTIYEEDGKTVFANWVYVSPRETVVLEYRYLLPLKIDLGKNSEHVDTYSLLAQKQSGSLGSTFASSVSFDKRFLPVWTHPEGNNFSDGRLKIEKVLAKDVFVGIVFQDVNEK